MMLRNAAAFSYRHCFTPFLSYPRQGGRDVDGTVKHMASKSLAVRSESFIESIKGKLGAFDSHGGSLSDWKQVKSVIDVVVRKWIFGW